MNRKNVELVKYLDEAFDKVWLMRNYTEDETFVGIEEIKRILNKYKDIPDLGYTEWECGYWNGVLGTLRWVLGDEEKDNLDT